MWYGDAQFVIMAYFSPRSLPEWKRTVTKICKCITFSLLHFEGFVLYLKRLP